MARPSSNENSKEEQQFIEKLVSVRRVTKVVKGGKPCAFLPWWL